MANVGRCLGVVDARSRQHGVSVSASRELIRSSTTVSDETAPVSG